MADDVKQETNIKTRVLFSSLRKAYNANRQTNERRDLLFTEHANTTDSIGKLRRF
jgi:hypothetical protein